MEYEHNKIYLQGNGGFKSIIIKEVCVSNKLWEDISKFKHWRDTKCIKWNNILSDYSVCMMF